jgi:hypothetical protein
MRPLETYSRAFGVCVTVALLAGCGAQPPIGAPGVMRQASAVAAHAADLLYVVNQDLSEVTVYTYPRGTSVEGLRASTCLKVSALIKPVIFGSLVPAHRKSLSILTAAPSPYARSMIEVKYQFVAPRIPRLEI